jgi:hypothetical protein
VGRRRAQTCLRPAVTAQPRSAVSSATRCSPTPPSDGSRPTAGSGPRSAAASLISINQPSTVPTIRTPTGPIPCPQAVGGQLVDGEHHAVTDRIAVAGGVIAACRAQARTQLGTQHGQLPDGGNLPLPGGTRVWGTGDRGHRIRPSSRLGSLTVRAMPCPPRRSRNVGSGSSPGAIGSANRCPVRWNCHPGIGNTGGTALP